MYNMLCMLSRAPLGGGLFRAPPPLVFLRYLLNQCRYHHQTCSTLSPNNFTHCVKILKSRARLEFWPFFGPFRVQKIIFSFRKIFSQYSVPYRTRSPWNSEHSTSSTVPHRITHRQTHGITTKAYSFNDVKYTVFSIYLIRNHEQIANITYSPSIIYSLGPETKLGIPTLVQGIIVWPQMTSE